MFSDWHPGPLWFEYYPLSDQAKNLVPLSLYPRKMRAVIQRVLSAKVTVDGAVTGQIANGLLVLLGIAKTDTPGDSDTLVEKILNLRIFPDNKGKMNLSLIDTAGSLLVVSQFTLYGDCRKGRRPSFDDAAPGEQARLLYEHFVDAARAKAVHVQTGIFQAHMEVSLVNEGPVTLIVESPPAAISNAPTTETA